MYIRNLRGDLFERQCTGYYIRLSDGDKYIFDFQVIRPLLCFPLLRILACLGGDVGFSVAIHKSHAWPNGQYACNIDRET